MLFWLEAAKGEKEKLRKSGRSCGGGACVYVWRMGRERTKGTLRKHFGPGGRRVRRAALESVFPVTTQAGEREREGAVAQERGRPRARARAPMSTRRREGAPMIRRILSRPKLRRKTPRSARESSRNDAVSSGPSPRLEGRSVAGAPVSPCDSHHDRTTAS